MIYSVEISQRAEEDLHEIFHYISDSLLSPQSAERLLSRIETSIMSLDNMPYRFSAYDKEPWRSRGVRKMTVDNFLVFYIPDDEKRCVTVIRIMYGGRDIDKVLSSCQ